MKIARVVLAACALLAAAACSRGAPTAPEDAGPGAPRNNLGTFGSGTLASEPPVKQDSVAALSLHD